MAVTKSYNGFPPKYREKQGYAVYKMFKTGELARPIECVGCGALANDGAPIMAHNEDYHNPLNFVGICYGCHMAIHYRFRDIPTWEKWCDYTANGWQPPYSRDYKVFLSAWDRIRFAPKETPQRFTWLHGLPHVEPNLYSPEKEWANDEFSF